MPEIDIPDALRGRPVRYPAHRPWCCPVCGGTGTVPEEFYYQLGPRYTRGARVKCRSCDGAGIVWGPN